MAEIAGQPAALRRAAEGLRAQRDPLDRIRSAGAGADIVCTGMGSSYDACYPISTELADAGVRTSMLGTAELLHFRAGMLRPRTLLIAVSQSGESAEIVALAGRVGELEDAPTLVAVTNGTDSELARAADVVLDTRAGEEHGPSTMTFAAALATLAGVGRVLRGDSPEAASAAVSAAADAAAVSIERILSIRLLGDDLFDWLAGRQEVVILARGPARAAAEMAALTLKEAAGVGAEALETAQFRHGPLELAGPGLAAVVIATEPETLSLDLGLAKELAASGAAVLLVTRDARPVAGAMQVAICDLDRSVAPAVSLVPAQLLAHRLALASGRRPGTYRRATKVTTRE